LGIDPTFNLGDFFVTPTVYEYKMLKNKVTGKHLFFNGPVRTENLTHTTILLQKSRPSIKGLVAIGTNGEDALSLALSK